MSSTDKEFGGIFLQTGRLKNEFIDEEAPIGSGSFGIVTKAKHLVDDKQYAIKKIIIQDKNALAKTAKTIRELKVWAKLDCDFFVQYRSSWVELSDEWVVRQFKSQPQFSTPEDRKYAVLHIQMDLCTFSLAQVLEQLKLYFKIEKKQLLPPIAYYISSELLLEILVCIKYLHEMNPQILHRDINPNNILIKKGLNGNFVKISDFGGAVEHEKDQTHTRMEGTMKYMAPEVMNSRKYDSSADVYSIAVMTQEMFNFDINGNIPMSPTYKVLKEITASAMAGHARDRPSCQKWYDQRKKWAAGYDTVSQQIIKLIDVKKEYDISKVFVQSFLKSKYLFNKDK